MRIFYFIPLLLLGCVGLSAQELVRERVADLRPIDYAISGDAILEEFDDGSLRLRLSEDFSTPAGPDVRIFLSNGATATGGVEVADLSEVNHFAGARTFGVPAGVTLDQFDRVFFYCRAFMQPWADGVLGEPTGMGGGFECLENTVSTEGEMTAVAVCPADGTADRVNLRNSTGTAAGEHYAYLITDANEVVQEVVMDDVFDFDGSGSEEQRVYGIHFDGELTAVIGANRLQTTAVGCFIHSSTTDFLTVTKDGCAAGFECRESLVATHDWVTQVDVCSTDGAIDTVFLQNNIGVAVGEHYVFLLTDTNEIVQEVITTDTYDFENSGTEKVRVYGLHFDGELVPALGETRRNTTSTGCSIHSGDDVFITVDRAATCVTSVLDRGLAAEVSVFPNPASTLLNVDLPERFRSARASMVNALGQTVRTQAVENEFLRFQLDVANLPAGQYVLRLEDGRRLVTKKITLAR